MYHFILNPVAGKGKTLSVMKKLEKMLNQNGINFTVHNTAYPYHATNIVASLTAGDCDNVIAVGGDGTVNEVLNGISNFDKCKMGIIPCGTGNDFAKFVGIPKDPICAMKLILNNNAVYTDFLLLNDKRVMNITGMGMDATVLERCKKMKIIKGKFQYYVALIVTLLNFKWYNFKISVDGGEEKDKTVMMIAVCNGKYFGGGMPISPKSDVCDNKMNVIIVNKMSKWKIPAALLGLMRGKILKYDFVENILCEKVHIKTDTLNYAINIDGELYKDIPYMCLVVKNQLKLFR